MNLARRAQRKHGKIDWAATPDTYRKKGNMTGKRLSDLSKATITTEYIGIAKAKQDRLSGDTESTHESGCK